MHQSELDHRSRTTLSGKNTWFLTGTSPYTTVRGGEEVSVRLLQLVLDKTYNRLAVRAGGGKEKKKTGHELRVSKGRLEAANVSQLL